MNARKRQLWMVAGIILVLILSACGSSTSGGSGSSSSGSGKTALKIMVGGLSKQIYLPNELTQRLGYFAAQGLDVTLIDEASGQSSENEVLAGRVHAPEDLREGRRASIFSKRRGKSNGLVS